MKEQLKPCPFCGETNLEKMTYLDLVGFLYWIECKRCDHVRVVSLVDMDDAIRKWNTRPVEKALNAEITRYRRALHNLKDDCKKRMLFVESDLEKLFLYETITHIEAELDYGKDTNVPANAPDTNVGNNEVKDE